MANEGSMKVNVARLRDLAADMNKVYNSYMNSLSLANKETDKLRNTWTGDAASSFLISYNTLNTKCNDFMTTLSNTVRVLYEVADTYEASEAAIESAAEKLPSLPTNTMV